MPQPLLSVALALALLGPLSDPQHHSVATLAQDDTQARTLTCADVDTKARVRAADGTYWIAESAGPSLLHVDAHGRLLAAPVEVPDPTGASGNLAAPHSPFYEEGAGLRIMQALWTEAKAHGATRKPICSPNHLLLADHDPTTSLDTRSAPPPGSGLARASSEIFDVQALQAAGFPVIPWTIDDPLRMRQLLHLGVQGIITDHPDRLRTELARANRAYYFTPDGLVDARHFDLQGHRGARDLRPENTLPAFEAGLDELCTTLETDCHFTRDHVLVLSHDGSLGFPKVRHADGTPIPLLQPIRDLAYADIRDHYVADGLLPDRPDQSRNLALSPVAVAFAATQHMRNPYAVPTLDQLLAFVCCYETYYRHNPSGVDAATASRRAQNAARVEFDLETKVRPVNTGGEPATDASVMTRAIAASMRAHGLERRANLESFDFRSLFVIAREYPKIRLVALLDDGPLFANPNLPGSDDSCNLQAPPGQTSPWLAGLRWPYRRTFLAHPPRVQPQGGLVGVTFAPDRHSLYTILGKPLVGDNAHQVWVQRYDCVRQRWTGERFAYPLSPDAAGVAGLKMVTARSGFVFELARSGRPKGIFGFALGNTGRVVRKWPMRAPY